MVFSIFGNLAVPAENPWYMTFLKLPSSTTNLFLLQLLDPDHQVLAILMMIWPTRYPLGNVYHALVLDKDAGRGTTVGSILMQCTLHP